MHTMSINTGVSLNAAVFTENTIGSKDKEINHKLIKKNKSCTKNVN